MPVRSEDIFPDLAALLRFLRVSESATRAQLLGRLGISRRSTLAALDCLLERALVQEVRGEARGAGRPAPRIRLASDLGYAIGIDVGLARARVVCTDIHGHILWRSEQPPFALPTIEAFPDLVLATAAAAIAEAGIPKEKLVALGVCFGGFMDDIDGTVSFSGLSSVEGAQYLWSGGPEQSIPLARQLSERSGLDAAVEDRPRAAAFAETRFGVARNAQHAIFIHVGSQDVSAGLFLGGRLYRGHRGVSGEIGHMVLRPDGPLCRCGNRGCLEVLSSGRAMVQAALAGIRGGIASAMVPRSAELTAETIVDAAKAGDKLCCQVVTDAARSLGEAVATLVNLFGPEIVVLGGLAHSSDGLFLDQVRDAVRQRTLSAAARGLRVAESSLGTWGPAQGVTAVAMARAFEPGGSIESLILRRAAAGPNPKGRKAGGEIAVDHGHTTAFREVAS